MFVVCWYLFVKDINSKGEDILENRPSGPDSEHRQPAKTINHKAQQRKRDEKRRRRLALKHEESLVEYNITVHLLNRNKEVEEELIAKTATSTIANCSIQDFLDLKPVTKLYDFIHVRKFHGKQFQKSKLIRPGQTLNKTLKGISTATAIEEHSSEENPCLVWLAWKLRATKIVMEIPTKPAAPTAGLKMPEFTVLSSGPINNKHASDYLNNTAWINSLKSVVKGVEFLPVNAAITAKSELLVEALRQRLDFHISGRVDRRRWHHWTLDFVRDNLAPVAAAMSLVGHIADDLDTYAMYERLLMLPTEDMLEDRFKIISNLPSDHTLGQLEGCYLYFDTKKKKWIRSGKTGGDGMEACFYGRGKKHAANSKLVDQMKEHEFYRQYPAKGVTNLGGAGGCFESLSMYCGMAFDKKQCVTSLCSNGNDNSLFVWSKQTIAELNKKKDGIMQRMQLNVVAYLWELCYDLLLASGENVSASPGFEAFGLRVNK